MIFLIICFRNNIGRDKDLRSVCDDARSFSRREPALFIGGVIAAGFLVSRFLRSSSHHSSDADNHATGANNDTNRAPHSPSYSQPSSLTESPTNGPGSFGKPSIDGRDSW
ncbi:MAG: hypothetical protein LC677_06885 [Halomonas sp.]|nr:hypothetical protein [Halomonas sp.]